MTLNQASRKLDAELQVINLLNAIQLRLRQEEEKEEAAEAAKRAEARPAETAAPAQLDAAPDGDANA